MVSDKMNAGQGVAAGSAHATFEATAMLPLEVRAHIAMHPGPGLSIHVDDFKESATNEGPAEAVGELCRRVASLVDRFERNLELPFGKGKTNIIGNSEEATRMATEALGVWAGGGASQQVRRLGYDYQLGSRRGRRPVEAIKTIAKGRSRCLRFRAPLGKKKIRYVPIFTAGVLPAALFGAEVVPLPGRELRVLANDGLRAAGFRFAGADTSLLTMCIDPKACPVYRAAAAPVLRWAREWWLAGRERVHRPEDCPSFPELVRAHDIGKHYSLEGPYRLWPKDPVAALRAAIRVFGWGWPSAGFFTDRQGVELQLAFGSPAWLESYLRRDYIAALEKKVVDKHLPGGGGEEVSFETFRRLVGSRAARSPDQSGRRCLVQCQAGALLTGGA